MAGIACGLMVLLTALTGALYHRLPNSFFIVVIMWATTGYVHIDGIRCCVVSAL